MFVEAVVFLAAIIGVLLSLSAFVFHMITRTPEAEPERVEKAVDDATDAALEEINRTSQLVMDELNEKYNALLFVYQLMDDKKKQLDEGALEAATDDGLEEADKEADKEAAETAGTTAEDKEATGTAGTTSETTAEEWAVNLDISVDDELDVVSLGQTGQTGQEGQEGQISHLEQQLKQLSQLYKQPDPPEKEEQVKPPEKEPEIKPEINSEIKPEIELPKIPFHPKYESIKELRAQGLDFPEIARQLNMGQGEIKLIIGLGGG